MSTMLPTSERPARTPATGPITATLRVTALLAALAITIWILIAYAGLPETIPTHFDLSGTADGWGPKWSILVLAAVMLLVSVGLAVLSAKPQILNYPVIITEHNAQAIYREGERLMVWALWAMQGIYLGIAWTVLLGGGGVVIGISAAILVSVVGVGVIRMLRVAR
ncbi:DUF1648 domain-containing protein [Brachybacterium sp. JB7]|nr:DUF1648 domain-containing protein [Brachybacterium sp. JB7]RCS77220.1 DUF1648 domain-containing protein [Brachybacterium alimentarium]